MKAKFRGKIAFDDLKELEAANIEIPHSNGWVVGSFIAPNLIVGDVADIDWDFFATEWWVKIIPETVGQYIGLKDVKGEMIFEGDIVKWDDRSDGRYWRFAVVGLDPDIQFNCKHLKQVDGVDNSTDRLFRFGNFIYKDTESYLEIVSNIYDNPELLKDK